MNTRLSDSIALLKGEGREYLHLHLSKTVSGNTITEFDYHSRVWKINSFVLEIDCLTIMDVHYLYSLAARLNKDDHQYCIALVIHDAADELPVGHLRHFVQDYLLLIKSRIFHDLKSATLWLDVVTPKD